MTESSCCSTALPAFGVVSVARFGPSDRDIVISHCCFTLHFPGGIWYGASLHRIIYHLYIFSGEVFLAPTFVIDSFVFLLLCFNSSLYVLDNSPFLLWHWVWTVDVFCKYLLPPCDLPFYSLNTNCCLTLVFEFSLFLKKQKPRKTKQNQNPLFFFLFLFSYQLLVSSYSVPSICSKMVYESVMPQTG